MKISYYFLNYSKTHLPESVLINNGIPDAHPAHGQALCTHQQSTEASFSALNTRRSVSAESCRLCASEMHHV